MKRSLRLVACGVVGLVLTSGLGAAAALGQGEGYTAPAPEAFDTQGTRHDWVCVPESFTHPTRGIGDYYIDGDVVSGGCWGVQSRNTVTVTTDHDSGTWVFEFRDDAPAYEAPAPTLLDPSGTDQDGFVIPEWPDNTYSGYYVIGDSEREAREGFHRVKEPTTVTVRAYFSSWPPEPVGSWDLELTDVETGPEAAHAYHFEVDGCRRRDGTGYRPARAVVTNTPDSSGRYIQSIYPDAQSAAGWTVYEPEMASRVLDGESATLALKTRDDLPGLLPGLYRVDFRIADRGYASSRGRVRHSEWLTVDPCGKYTGMDPQATGVLRGLSCRRFAAIADARAFDVGRIEARFKVLTEPAGLVRKRSFSVPGRSRAIVRKKIEGREGARVTLYSRYLSGSGPVGPLWTLWIPQGSIELPPC